MAECVICYESRVRASLKCRNKHAICSACIERGSLISVCSHGCPTIEWVCPCCREKSHSWTRDIGDLKIARCVIDALQRKMREDDDDE